MKTTEQKNHMIAEFMGYHFDEHENAYYIQKYNSGDWFSIEELLFHESWDWLMPVVEKIESLGFNVEKNFQPIDKDFQCLITKGNDILFQEFNEYSITAMHYVVVEFIEFYNKQES